MKKFAVVTLAIATMVACGGKDTGDTGDTAAPGTTPGTTPTPITGFSVTMTADGMDVTVTGGEGTADFGVAETNSSAGYFGEDCMTGTCYTVDADATTSISNSAGDTLFNDTFSAADLTFYLGSADGCWVYGHDVAYYASEGCTEL